MQIFHAHYSLLVGGAIKFEIPIQFLMIIFLK